MKLSNPVPVRKARIELIPLIDVMFFLLASFIFVSLSMVQQKGIKVDVPKAATGEANRKEYSAVSVTAEGELFLDKNPVSMEELRAALQQMARRSDKPRLSISADRQARHGDVVAVLDATRQAGLSKVSFETRPLDGSRP